MTEAMSNGTFFERYKPYFRFSDGGDGDAGATACSSTGCPHRCGPFTKQVFTQRGQKLMNALRVPQTLGEENRKLVAGSPLLLGVMLDRPSTGRASCRRSTRCSAWARRWRTSG